MARIAYYDEDNRALDPSIPASEVYMITERELEPIIQRFKRFAEHYGVNRIGVPAMIFIYRVTDTLLRFGADTFDGSLHPAASDEAPANCPTCGRGLEK